MAVDESIKQVVDETFKAIKDANFTHDALLRISPRRMRSLLLFSQQTMRVQMEGCVITLQEDSDAQELDAEIAEVLGITKDVEPDIEDEADLQEFLAWKASRGRK